MLSSDPLLAYHSLLSATRSSGYPNIQMWEPSARYMAMSPIYNRMQPPTIPPQYRHIPFAQPDPTRRGMIWEFPKTYRQPMRSNPQRAPAVTPRRSFDPTPYFA